MHIVIYQYICYFRTSTNIKYDFVVSYNIRASILNTSHIIHTTEITSLTSCVHTYEAYIYDNIYYTRVISTLSKIIKYTLILKHIYIPYASSPYPDPPYPEPS